MKQLFVIISFLALSATTTFAETWVVFIDRGDETIVLYMKEKPFIGEGVTVLGPFPDRTSPTVNNTDISASAQRYTSIEQAGGVQSSVNDPSTAEGYLTYKKGNTINIIQLSETSDWKGIKEWIENNGGCTPSGFGFFFRQNGNGNSIKINGKEISLRKEPVTVSYGDILINNEPIDFE